MTNTPIIQENRHLSVEVASLDAFDVRQFSVEESMSALFAVELVVLADDPALDFDAIVGRPARFALRTATSGRIWSGIVNHIEQVKVEERGLSTYELTIVPDLWLATQRRNYRMFQQMTEPDVVLRVLREWGIEPEVRIDRTAYKKRKYRVQYGESDHAFLNRMLEDAGIAYFFEESDAYSRLLLSDTPQAAARRDGRLTFVDSPPPGEAPLDYVTAVRIGQRVRPGKYTMRDRDYRLPPSYPLAASASSGRGVEERLERYHYTPGAFLVRADKGESTPAADDKGKTRSDAAEGALLAQKRLDAKRVIAKQCTFRTNAHDLAPGRTITIGGHPHPLLSEGKALLVVRSKLTGTSYGEWTHEVEARSADVPYRPSLVTPKPKVNGVESATVVGPQDQEIHVDEFGRVRVHFHWDRESRMDDDSSCWIPVSHPWGGAGYGGLNLPRVGQEVLVDFLGGDPDRPIVVGRVYTNLQKVPYRLPEHKTRSAWKSNSTGATGGFNEIMFEDLQDNELVYEQAQKNRRRLVKNNETLTVGNDRQKLVKANETEETRLHRIEVTGMNRTELTSGNRVTVIGGNREKLIKGSETERTAGSAKRTVDGSEDRVVEGSAREKVNGSHHVMVGGSESVKVGGAHSLTVEGSRHEKVGQDLAVEAREEIHIKAGKKMVLEVGEDFTIKGPGGGFIRLNAEGLTMHGQWVKINSGGSPGTGKGASPELPAAAAPAEIAEPARPEVDDVGRTGIGQ